MEVPKSTPTAGLFLELGILPAQFVIELKQVTFLKKILDRDKRVPLKEYTIVLKHPSEDNWADNVLDLRLKYNLPQNDDNIANMTWPMWKKMIKNTVRRLLL